MLRVINSRLMALLAGCGSSVLHPAIGAPAWSMDLDGYPTDPLAEKGRRAVILVS